MEGDDAVVAEGLQSLEKLADRADADKVQALLAGEADGNDTYLEIHAGAGGTESQDWAEMLLRMYSRWAERRLQGRDGRVPGRASRPGIKSATLLIKGEERLWLRQDRERRAPASCGSALTTARAAATPASARCGSIR
jgi:peptide chain release factor 2